MPTEEAWPSLQGRFRLPACSPTGVGAGTAGAVWHCAYSRQVLSDDLIRKLSRRIVPSSQTVVKWLLSWRRSTMFLRVALALRSVSSKRVWSIFSNEQIRRGLSRLW